MYFSSMWGSLRLAPINIYRDRDFREKSHMTGFVIDGHLLQLAQKQKLMVLLEPMLASLQLATRKKRRVQSMLHYVHSFTCEVNEYTPGPYADHMKGGFDHTPYNFDRLNLHSIAI